MKKFKKFLRFILIIVFILSALYTAFTYYREQKDDIVYNEVDKYIDSIELPTVPTIEDTTDKKAPVLGPEVEIIPNYQIDYDWDSLVSKNKDIVGWMYIPDNDYINYPVVQGTNNDYYLNHDYLKKWNANGAAFVDYKYNSLCLSKVVYGHNMNRDSSKPMFTSLKLWKEEDYFNSHRYLYFTDVTGKTTKYLIFALAGLDVRDDDTFDYLQMFFETEEELRTWLEYLEEKSIIYDLDGRTVDYKANELLVLSTCDRTFGFGKNGRLVMFCVNVSNNEVNLDGIELP